ncbi:hypothetical protein TSUD_300250 [Trifolium subterraneum]|uniref:Uncharacterized protein n=1 Tax=Trifolium subterraneum TaxID=3900 RepID=A0A2Z6PJ55_TRISU|nr:hypothetical protein TSUD_300250 [Trifolium subterraneum]
MGNTVHKKTTKIQRYWRVGEVYIPDKRDGVGKRFGFVRFEDVEDQQKLLQRIEETWIGTYKIRANLPKFLRGAAKKPVPNGGDGRRIEPVLNEIAKIQKDNLNAQIRGQTFKEVMQGGGKSIPRNKQNEWIVKANGKRKSRLTDEEYRAGIMAIEAEAENLKHLEGSFVGKLKEFADADNIQVTLWMEGFQQIKARFLGLDLILLTSTIKDEIQRAYESNKEWWERRFLSLTPWRPNIRPNRRRIWVRLFGVPLHIWSYEGFKKIIWRYGKLLNLDRETSEQIRFDVARAQIEVSYWEMVDEVIEVKVDEEIFIIRMVEERFGCIDVVNGGDLVGEEVVCTAGKDGDTISRMGTGEGVLNEDERCLKDNSKRIISDSDGEKMAVEVVSTAGVDGESNPRKVSGDDGSNYDGGGLVENTDRIVPENGGDMVAEEVLSMVGIDQRVDTAAVVSTGQKEDRETQFQKEYVQVGATGFEVVDSEGDGDVGGSRGTRSGSGWERVKETQEPRVADLQLGSQVLVINQEVGDEVGNPDIGESGAGLAVGNGLQSTGGPSSDLGQRAGKQILVYDNNNNNKLIFNGSTSI